MLKGHVFSNQIFENQIFALFINTFLDGADGISGNYKNSMDLSYEGSVITINAGAICIQGRFLEESSTTEVDVGTDTGYGSLVIEIDLDENNTTTVLNQAYYKILTDTSDYPELEQTEIVKNNSGIYQYELARFQIDSDGITNFQDMRTYLDFDSIYTYIKTEYEELMTEQEESFMEWFENLQVVLSDDVAGNLQTEIENLESRVDTAEDSVVYKDNFAIITGTLDVSSNTSTNLAANKATISDAMVTIPDGFSEDSVIIGFNATTYVKSGYGCGDTYAYDSDNYTGNFTDSTVWPQNVLLKSATLAGDNIIISAANFNTESYSLYYKIVLMNIE